MRAVNRRVMTEKFLHDEEMLLKAHLRNHIERMIGTDEDGDLVVEFPPSAECIAVSETVCEAIIKAYEEK